MPEKETAASPDGASIDDLVHALGADIPDGEIRLVEELPIDADDDLTGVAGDASPRLVSIVESLLFTASRPLTVKQIRKLLRDPTAKQIQLALSALIKTTQDRGVVVSQVAGGFVLRTNAQNASWVQRLLQARPVRLSRPQLESLSVISYRQPVTKAEIDHIRGVDSSAVLRLLLEKDLIKIVGKKEEPGRPMLYGTTVGFLEFFNLRTLRDLPDLREFRELSEDTKDLLKTKMEDDEVEALGQEVLDFAARGLSERAGLALESLEEEDSDVGDEVEGETTDETQTPSSPEGPEGPEGPPDGESTAEEP